jgi:murein DD-endopeptidase MepM/ murein hydrolase activator NlpD
MLNAITRTDARLLQQFGINPSWYQRFGLPGHDGIDLECLGGDQLYAPAPGTIAGCLNDPTGWGYNLAIDLDSGGRVYLCHLYSFQGSHEGDHVEAGTPVCLAGMSGNTNWPHVHVTLVADNNYRATPYRGRIDPEPWLAGLGMPEPPA